MIGFSKALQEELGPKGKQVYVICPGCVDTEIIPVSKNDERRTRMLKPDEIASLVFFLASQSPNTAIGPIEIRPQFFDPDEIEEW